MGFPLPDEGAATFLQVASVKAVFVISCKRVIVYREAPSRKKDFLSSIIEKKWF
jgi:hypothetical protein